MGYGHHIYLGEEPLALLGDSNGPAFKAHRGLVARDNNDRRAHHECSKNGI